MNQQQKYVLQSALLGSLLLSVFGFFVVPAEATLSDPTSFVHPAREVEVEVGIDESVEEVGCELSARYPDRVQRWCSLISRVAGKHQFAPDLIAAVMLQESGGDPFAYSHSGAVGLMQVMPRDGLAAEFMCVNGPCFTDRPTMRELQDPDFNVAYGVALLASLRHKYGDIREALRAYGPMDMGYAYADKVLRIWEQYGE